MKKVSVALAGLLVLGACGEPPMVTDFNGDSVTIQSQTAANNADVTAEAQRICTTVGRKAEYASSRQVHAPQYMVPTYNHLFLCLA